MSSTTIQKYEVWRTPDGYCSVVQVTHSFFNGVTIYRIMHEKKPYNEAKGIADKLNIR